MHSINEFGILYGSLRKLNEKFILIIEIDYFLSYFDREIKGKQIFNNSMYPLEQHPKYKALVVIDDIVFTSSCKCDSANQPKMFPHYRVTCAVSLTCPARLNNIEKIIWV